MSKNKTGWTKVVHVCVKPVGSYVDPSVGSGSIWTCPQCKTEWRYSRGMFGGYFERKDKYDRAQAAKKAEGCVVEGATQS